MWIFRRIIIIYLLVNLPILNYSQDTRALFNNVSYGKYNVGFKLIEKFDYSRIYQCNKMSKTCVRPMQIGLWFPAEKDITNQNQTKLKLEDYITLASRSESLIKNDSLEQIAINNFLNASHVNRSKASELLKIQTKASLLQKPLRGRFPLVIFAPGSSAEFYENFMLCEYLASKGYVVMSSKSRGQRNPTINALWSGVESQTRDMEFIMAEAHNYNFIDVNQINSIGRSWGSISALVFSIRNKEVTNSITSLDGTLSYNASELMKDSPYPTGKFVYKPIFLAVGKKRSEKATPIDRVSYFENVEYANAYTVEYNEMRHTAFSSFYLLYHYLLNKGIDEKTSEDLIKGYVDNIKHVENFLDVHNNNNSGAWSVASTEDYTFNSKKASAKLLPNYEDFGYALEVNGVDSAIRLYEEARKTDPEYANKELFNANYINAFAYRSMANSNTGNAIKLIQMALKAFPNNANLYDSYGEFLLNVGKKEEALIAYKKSLELNPNNENAKKAIQQIEN